MTHVARLISAAARLGVTQRQLAAMIGVSRQQLWFWIKERNAPSPIRQASISDVYSTLLEIEKSDTYADELRENPTVEQYERISRRIRRIKASGDGKR